MKKLLIIVTCLSAVFILQNCSGSKKAIVKMVSYETDIVPILQVSCTPCHFPPAGNKKPLNSYEAVKANIGDILVRVKLPHTDNKFMPFKSKKPALSDSAIKVLELWQTQAMSK